MMKVAFCCSEAVPYAKTGGLADVCGALPEALSRLGIETHLFLPRYRDVERVKCSLNNVRLHWITNDAYFNRGGLYGDDNGDFTDNLERYQFYCEAVLKTIREQQLVFDIIHCHDWHAALIPVYLKEKFQHDACFKSAKSLLTVHNLAFQGVFDYAQKAQLKLNTIPDAFEFYGKLNLLKAGIYFSDEVSTVSPQYAKEIQTKEFGCGIEETLRAKGKQLIGILNGVDFDFWNPQTDAFIKENYSSQNFCSGKSRNKTLLQEQLKLSVDGQTMLLGFVGRLSHQKGIDLILESLDDLLQKNIQIVIQGVGDAEYQRALQAKAYQYPGRIAVCFKFDETSAHQIYAGSDAFLMPSNFEPCGLSQLISFRYGTIPIVYHVGGLVDTVKAYDQFGAGANGFRFTTYDRFHFSEAVAQALDCFMDKPRFQTLVENALKEDFSWEHSAREYVNLYQCLLSD